MSDDPLALALRLVKAGYGSLREVEEFDARRFLQCLAYENFLGDYEAASWYINSKR